MQHTSLDNFSIWNDASLLEGFAKEDLKKVHRSYTRNPLIADIYFSGGKFDSWVRGTFKIIEACNNVE